VPYFGKFVTHFLITCLLCREESSHFKHHVLELSFIVMVILWHFGTHHGWAIDCHLVDV